MEEKLMNERSPGKQQTTNKKSGKQFFLRRMLIRSQSGLSLWWFEFGTVTILAVEHNVYALENHKFSITPIPTYRWYNKWTTKWTSSTHPLVKRECAVLCASESVDNVRRSLYHWNNRTEGLKWALTWMACAIIYEAQLFVPKRKHRHHRHDRCRCMEAALLETRRIQVLHPYRRQRRRRSTSHTQTGVVWVYAATGPHSDIPLPQ